MNNNYQKALKKVEQAQKEYKCFNCCYPLFNQTNLAPGPTGPTGATGPQGEMGPTGPQGVQGLQGVQGIPGPQGEVGETGPEGPTGPSGTSVTIMGSYDSLDDLLNEHPRGNLGDSYLVGENLYVWSNNGGGWVNVGNIRGPQGEIGPTGPQGEIGPQGEMGEQGVQGLQGIPGERGEQGVPGPMGPQGPSGYALLSAYGGKYNNMQTVINTMGTGTWVQVPLGTPMDNINIINQNENALELEQDGIYEINYNLNVATDKETILTLWVRENSVMIPSTVTAKKVIPSITFSFSGSTIVELKAGDKLDMEISATEDNVDVTFASGITASLSVKKLDEIE